MRMYYFCTIAIHLLHTFFSKRVNVIQDQLIYLRSNPGFIVHVNWHNTFSKIYKSQKMYCLFKCKQNLSMHISLVKFHLQKVIGNGPLKEAIRSRLKIKQRY